METLQVSKSYWTKVGYNTDKFFWYRIMTFHLFENIILNIIRKGLFERSISIFHYLYGCL